MDIPTWLGVNRIHEGGDGVMSVSLTDATTFFNAFQALSGNCTTDTPGNFHPLGMIGDVLMALCIAAVSRHAYHFVVETWPSWAMRFLSKCFSTHRTTDAAVVDVFSSQPEELVFDNELLVHAMERYVAHLLSLPGGTQQPTDAHNSDVATTTTTTTTTSSISSSSHDDDGGSARFLRLRLLPTAEFRYVPITSLETVCRRGLTSILRRYFRLLLFPAYGHTVEVEPGLTVCFQQQRVSGAALCSNKIIPRRREPQQQQQQQQQQHEEEEFQERLMKEFLPLNFDTKPVKIAFSPSDTGRDNGDNRDTDGSSNSDDTEDPDADDRPSMVGTGNEVKQFLVRQAVLQCTDCKSGKERIMDFARCAYAWYHSTVVEPTERYYFYPANSEVQQAMRSTESVPSEVTQRLHMRRSLLSQGRNGFNTLFFREKLHLIEVLTEFKEKKGKFAVSGVPHQLVLLLYGPPGTGKTSVVRRVAAFLNRHIVAVPIEFIQTNGALQELLTGGTTMLHGETRVVSDDDDDWTDELPCSDRKPMCYDLSADEVVYVFEDVDVVTEMISFQIPPEQRTVLVTALRNAYNEVERDNEAAVTSSSSGSGTTTKIDSSSDTIDGNAEEKCSTHAEDNEEGDEGTSVQMKHLLSYQKLFASDFLSPEGLLRAVEANFSPPGRVIIFTTNHVERLPSVLWRPGLLTLAIHMDLLDAETATQLVAHYYSDSLTPELRRRLEEMFAHFETEGIARVMTPAWLQQFILNCSNLEEVLQELENQR